MSRIIDQFLSMLAFCAVPTGRRGCWSVPPMFWLRSKRNCAPLSTAPGPSFYVFLLTFRRTHRPDLRAKAAMNSPNFGLQLCAPPSTTGHRWGSEDIGGISEFLGILPLDTRSAQISVGAHSVVVFVRRCFGAPIWWQCDGCDLAGGLL